MDKLAWERHLCAFRESKLSVRAYAREHALIYHQLLYRVQRSSQPIPGSGSEFVPVTLAAKPGIGACLGVVEFPTGARLIIHSPEVVRMLLEWLVGRI